MAKKTPEQIAAEMLARSQARQDDRGDEVGRITREILTPQPQDIRQKLQVASIRRSSFQPRVEFDRGELQSLADSIVQSGGLIQPIIVRRRGNAFELLAGERRLQTHELILGWEEIDAIVREVDDATAAKIAVLENLDRVDLADFEKSRALRILFAEGSVSTDAQAAKILHCSASLIAKLRRFNDLPPAIEAVLYRSARAITVTTVEPVLAAIAEGKLKYVLKGLELIEQSKLKPSGLLRYVEKESGDSLSPQTALMLGNKKLGTMVVGRSRITVTVERGVNAKELADTISKLINSQQ